MHSELPVDERNPIVLLNGGTDDFSAQGAARRQ